MTGTIPEPYALLNAFILDTGDAWGEVAKDWQRADARAIIQAATWPQGEAITDDTNETIGSTPPRRHWLLRGRGMSKTSDTAAVALALMLTAAPHGSRSHAYASDTDQAAILLDSIHGLAERSGLLGLVEISAKTLRVKRTGATLTVESADGASAFGLRPWLTIVDEMGVWPNTANHRRLWSAIISAVPKVPGATLVVIGTAGSPSGLGAEVWTEAGKSPYWHTSKNPGPAPWWTPEDIEATKNDLSASEYRRLILCEWAEGDDALTTPEDVEAAIRPGVAVLPRRSGIEYVAALDVGTRRDLTALAIGHVEHRESGRTVVIDRVLSWRPTQAARVDLTEVEAAVLRVCRDYRVSRLKFDRMQAEQLTTNLAREGVRCEEFVFSAAGANRLARTLWGALRDRALELPDDEETRNEFLTTRLVETTPGTVKLQNPPGTHDDLVTAIGMIATDLLSRPDVGAGRITSAVSHKLPKRTLVSASPVLPPRLAARSAARKMPRGLPGGGAIVGVPRGKDRANELGDVFKR